MLYVKENLKIKGLHTFPHAQMDKFNNKEININENI